MASFSMDHTGPRSVSCGAGKSCDESGSKPNLHEGSLRVVKEIENSAGKEVKTFYHPGCFFLEMVPRAKAWSLTSTDDLGGFSDLSPEEQEQVSGLLAEALEIVDKKEASPAKSSKKGGKGGKKASAPSKKAVTPPKKSGKGKAKKAAK